MSNERNAIMSNKIKKVKRAEQRRQARERKGNEKMFEWIMGVYSLVILCAFPLVYHDHYFDILETKYAFYWASSVAMMVVMVGYGLISGQIGDFFKGSNWKKTGKRIWKSLNFVDWAMLAFWLSNVISWILCVDWRWDAFWGTFGRYNGVFLMTVYTAVYFFVTRFFRFRQWYLDAFLVTGMLACGLGIVQYFQIDLLGFKAEMSEVQLSGYTSTFGNINTYTIYAGAVLVVAVILFTQEKNWLRMFWYFAAMMVAGVALIIGNSDNAYLTLAALFGLSPLYLFRTMKGFRRYLISLAAFFTSAQIVEWINVKFADRVFGIDSLFTMIVQYEHFRTMMIALWMAAAIVTVLTFRKKDGEDGIGKWAVCLWMAVIAAVVLAVAYVLYDANMGGNAEKYSAISKYVVFNDSWGTGRGFAWRRSMEIYREFFTLKDKIFGYGPETFRVLMENFYLGESGSIVFDNAHNEYLHYLITIGFVGMMSYIAWLLTSVIKMAKSLKGRPEVAACMFALAAYAVQATVNLNLPVAMPITVQLLAMGLCRGPRKEKEENEL